MNWKRDEWTGCYPSNWKGVVSPHSMAHPAKYSSKLIRRIYEHMKAEGWLKEGDMVLDPFGGVGLGGLDAARLGFNWVGNELELKFHRLGQGMDCPGFDKAYWRRYQARGGKWNSLNICPECGDLLNGGGVINEFFGVRERAIPTREAHRYHGNIETWEIRYPHVKGKAVLLHGDSRFLLSVLKGQGGNGVVSSPPYADSINSGTASIDWEKAGRPDRLTTKAIGIQGANGREERYGHTDGQLGAMKGDNFAGAVGSPPYADGAQHTGGNDPHPERMQGGMYHGVGIHGAVSSPPYADSLQTGNDTPRESDRQHRIKMGRNPDSPGSFNLHDYGATDGQLGGMKAEGFTAAISSPPYKNEVQGGGLNVNKPATFRGVLKDGSLSMGESEGNLSAMPDEMFTAAISSPPFRHSEGGTPEPKPGGAIDAALYARHAAGNSAAEGYGGTDGQLANMDDDGFQAAISSPPYADIAQTGGTEGLKKHGTGLTQGDACFSEYGGADGQLGRMNGDGFEGAVSSPPFEGVTATQDKNFLTLGEQAKRTPSKSNMADYGNTEGQLGANSGQDFWLAARAIVEQVYQALAPGAHCAWVVKGFVKDKKYVDFPDQWRQLCEAVGFKTVHEHRAMLVHNKGKSHTLDGEVVEHKTESKSFFRRLAEKKGSPRVDWETVYCMVKGGE